MRTPQPSANLFIIIINNWERLLFQGWSDLRRYYLPLTALLHKCVGPDKFSIYKILFSLLRFDAALADNNSGVAIETHLQILDLEFGQLHVSHALQIGSLVHDAAVRPNNRAIVSLEPPRV